MCGRIEFVDDGKKDGNKMELDNNTHTVLENPAQGGGLKCFRPLLNRFFKVNDIVLVVRSHVFGSNHKVRRGLIYCHGNIVDLGNTHQRLDVRVVRLCGERVGKEYHKVNHAFDNLCANLLISA